MSQTGVKLVIYREGAFFQDLWLNANVITIGRAADNSLCLNSDPTISRYHAKIALEAQGFVLTDVGSTEGTCLNGVRLQSSIPHRLQDGDQLTIGKLFQITFKDPSKATANLDSSPLAPTILDPLEAVPEKTFILPLGHQATASAEPAEILNLRECSSLDIGRGLTNGLHIDHPSVSLRHAQIKIQDGSYRIFDLNSTNGTFVNGELVRESQKLSPGDTIHIGGKRMVFSADETLIKTSGQGSLRIDAINLEKRVSQDLNLLNRISVSIQSKEFVAIAGVSGGGKSTLLDALNGFRPATSGAVYINGIDLYKNFNAYRTEIGYVPQKDIVHMELTVEDALQFAAKLRMPADTTLAERHQRVEEVMGELGLTVRRAVQIKKLSGGQLKRVSIGVELLTKPSLFYLDEATSGLDPGIESELMQLLRELADQGRTVLLITHATENVMLCDQVIFMGRGGNLAFFGPPQEALKYFEVQRFNEIYRKVENEGTPEEWRARYLQSSYYQQYVVERQKTLAIQDCNSPAQKRNRQAQPGAEIKRASSWRQFVILSQRNLAILMRDRISLLLMLAVAPLLGLMDLFAWPKNLLDLEKGNPSLTISMLFTAILIAVMVGSVSTMREIVKEMDIYKRERMIGLQIAPYVFSKVWVAVLLSVYQAVIFVLFKSIAIDLPKTPAFLGCLFVTLALATLSGMMMGLLGSAISPNQSVAPMIVLLLLIPQILFGGGVLPIETFGAPGKILNSASLTKWPFEAMVTLTGFGQDVARDRCWTLTKEARDGLTKAQKQDCKCMGANVFKTCNFAGVRKFYSPAVDQPEPVQPVEPKLASDSTAEEQLAYQTDIADYQTKLKDWNEVYKNWNVKYSRAISEAEGNINGLREKFGQAFNVNITTHLLIFSASILIMLGMTIAAQKVKDLA